MLVPGMEGGGMRKTLMVAALVAMAAGVADAAPLTFFGEDLGLGEFVRLPAHPNADAARNSFAANLAAGVLTEDFEGLTPTSPPTAGPQTLPLAFGSDTATLVGEVPDSPGGVVAAVTLSGLFGRVRVEERVAFLRYEEKDEPVDETEDLAVVLLAVEVA